MITKYRIQKLIAPSSINHDGKKPLVAIPFASDHTRMVIHNGQYMIIQKKTKPVAVRTFNDKFGRNKQYRLFYHEWVPHVPKEVPSVTNALSKMTPEKLQEMKQKVFGSKPV